MNLIDAIKKAANREGFPYTTAEEGYYFFFVGWEDPSTGKKYGPLLVSQVGSNSAVEIDRNGRFVGVLGLDSPYYFPWYEEEEKLKEVEILIENEKAKKKTKKKRKTKVSRNSADK